MQRPTSMIHRPAHKLCMLLTASPSHEVINRMVEVGVLDVMLEFLNAPTEELVKLTLFGLSNIAVDSQKSADTVLRNESLVYRLLVLMDHHNSSI